MDRNRHGIAQYRPARPRCIWRSCAGPQSKGLPLCLEHAKEVYDYVKVRMYPDPEPVPIPTKAPPADPKQGWVYYVRTDGHYKIGFAQDVRARMKAYPPTSVLLAQHRGTMADEKAIHHRFAAFRVAGREWFRIDPEITAYIDGVIAVHGRCVDQFQVRRVKGRKAS